MRYSAAGDFLVRYLVIGTTAAAYGPMQQSPQSGN